MHVRLIELMCREGVSGEDLVAEIRVIMSDDPDRVRIAALMVLTDPAYLESRRRHQFRVVRDNDESGSHRDALDSLDS